jgi:predicted acyltransferase
LSSGIFFTLTGASIAFFEHSRRKRGWTEWQITRFLLIRATILLVLDQVINRLGWGVREYLFEILSSIAFCIIVLSVVRHLSLRLIGLLALVLFIFYPLLVTLFPYDSQHPLSIITTILVQHHRDGPPLVETPALSRLSLVLAGYVLGRLLNDGKITISARWLWAALTCLIAWFVLRRGLLQGYGDFLPYEAGTPWINFFIESKHPPSLTFHLFNMAWSIVLLVAVKLSEDRLKNTFIGWFLTTLGQTALFFFVVHMLLYSGAANVLGETARLPSTWFGGSDLPGLFLELALSMAILAPMCAVYRNLRRKYSLLSYL